VYVKDIKDSDFELVSSIYQTNINSNAGVTKYLYPLNRGGYKFFVTPAGM